MMLGVKVKMKDGIAETLDRDSGKVVFLRLAKGTPVDSG